DCQPCGHNVCC
uniref:Conotoxin qc16a n=2 Tax=Conus quercinus TaxID=101313 RepID=CUGA_CONQU|nr:RecName: Full=Conotoxin qc16a [Conus quercinus]